MTTAIKSQQETELVWLPKGLAKRVKEVTDAAQIENEVVKFIEETKKDFRQELATFDDDVLMFRGLLIQARQSLKDAYQEHYDLNYKVWESFQDDIKKGKDFAEAATVTLRPVIDSFAELTSLMNSINKWDLEGLLKLMQELNSASAETRTMLRFLMENFRREGVS
jgi:hypothetical protein